MNKSHNYITINNPNGPVGHDSVPFAQWVDAPVDPVNIYNAEVAKVQVMDMHLPNFSMRVSQGQFSQDAMLINTSANGIDLLGSCLFPQGHIQSQVHSGEVQVESTSGTQNFKYDPMNEYRHKIVANTPFNIIHFSVNPDHFLQFLPEDESWSDELRSKIFNNERVMGERSTSITRAQERALQTILDCPVAGKLGEFMIETSITQIMILQLHSLFQNQSIPSTQAVAKRDLDIIHGLKEYLSKTFLDDHSLENLARQFGTNTNKLMILFKKFFGQSIFDYISELKMEYAHHLLRDEDKMVTEVARVVGYKNPNHFSAAFKRKYGINPSQARA